MNPRAESIFQSRWQIVEYQYLALSGEWVTISHFEPSMVLRFDTRSSIFTEQTYVVDAQIASESGSERDILGFYSPRYNIATVHDELYQYYNYDLEGGEGKPSRAVKNPKNRDCYIIELSIDERRCYLTTFDITQKPSARRYVVRRM